MKGYWTGLMVSSPHIHSNQLSAGMVVVRNLKRSIDGAVPMLKTSGHEFGIQALDETFTKV